MTLLVHSLVNSKVHQPQSSDTQVFQGQNPTQVREYMEDRNRKHVKPRLLRQLRKAEKSYLVQQMIVQMLRIMLARR